MDKKVYLYSFEDYIKVVPLAKEMRFLRWIFSNWYSVLERRKMPVSLIGVKR